MNSAAQVQLALTQIVKAPVAQFQSEAVASRLSDASRMHAITLSAYGYLKYLFEHVGYKILWRNVACSPKRIEDFAQEAINMRDDLPGLLVNARHYFERVLGSVPDLEAAIACVEKMTYPYVLYLLYMSSGKPDFAEKYRDEAKETAKRYPAMFDLLPDNMREIGKELLNE